MAICTANNVLLLLGAPNIRLAPEAGKIPSINIDGGVTSNAIRSATLRMTGRLGDWIVHALASTPAKSASV